MRKNPSAKKSSPPGTNPWKRMFMKSRSVSLKDDTLSLPEPKAMAENGEY